MSMEHEIAFRLPLEGWPRAIFRTTFGYQGGQLEVDGKVALKASSRQELETGLAGNLPDSTHRLELILEGADTPVIGVTLDGQRALLEEELSAPPSRSAWLHAFIALAASAAGFAAGYIYLMKARDLGSAWSMKMANHMAGWHLLLTLTLFPASVWGQRIGIRVVQGVCLVFFFIHVGIAWANVAPSDAGSALHDGWIAGLNGLSGIFFLLGVLYGQRAHRDMDPVAALKRGLIDLDSP